MVKEYTFYVIKIKRGRFSLLDKNQPKKWYFLGDVIFSNWSISVIYIECESVVEYHVYIECYDLSTF